MKRSTIAFLFVCAIAAAFLASPLVATAVSSLPGNASAYACGGDKCTDSCKACDKCVCGKDGKTCKDCKCDKGCKSKCKGKDKDSGGEGSK